MPARPRAPSEAERRPHRERRYDFTPPDDQRGAALTAGGSDGGKGRRPAKDRTVLHVIRSLHPDYGGPVEGIRQLIGGYAAQGWSVEVACLDDPASPWIASFPAPVHALGPGLGKYGFRLQAIGALRGLLKRFDAIVVDGIWEFTGPLALLSSIGSNKPYFVFVHGMLDPWFKLEYPLKHLKKWLYWPWTVYWVLRNARRVLFTTEEERLLARSSFWLYRCREAVVGYGTTEPSGDAEQQRSAFLAAFPAAAGTRNILFIGRIHPKKGCDLLIKAFASLAGDPDWRLVMAGPDTVGLRHELEAIALKAGIADRLIWTGPLKDDLKWGAFHAADAFALTSHQENFGVAVTEALACGLPVLISDKVNIWREVEADGAGLVGSDDLAGSQDLLQRWAAMSPAEVAAMRIAAKQSFERQFDVRSSSRQLVQVLEASD